MSSRRQMIAIILNLKKRGLWRETVGASTALGKKARAAIVTPKLRGPIKTKISLVEGAKPVSYRMSTRASKLELSHEVYSPQMIRSYIQAMPASHRKSLKIKGIYVLDNFEFKGIMGGIHRRGDTSEQIRKAAQMYRKAVYMHRGMGLDAPQIMGLHHKGRVFLNSRGLERYMSAQKKMMGEYTPPTGAQAKNVVIHELAHNLDNPAQAYGTKWGQITKMKKKPRQQTISLNDEYARAMTGATVGSLSSQAKPDMMVMLSEGWAGTYAARYADPKAFREVLSLWPKDIKKAFNASLKRLEAR